MNTKYINEAARKVIQFIIDIERLQTVPATIDDICELSLECEDVYHYKYIIADIYNALQEIQRILQLIIYDKKSIIGKLKKYRDSKYFLFKITTYNLQYLILATKTFCYICGINYEALRKEVESHE